MTRFKKIVFLREAGYTDIVYHFRSKDNRLFVDSIGKVSFTLTTKGQAEANKIIDELWEAIKDER